MPKKLTDPADSPATDRAEASIIEVGRKEALLKTGALQGAILNSANFSIIATDEKGTIQLFNIGAERMLGFAAAGMVNKMTPAQISDPHEVIARAAALSRELSTRAAQRGSPVAPRQICGGKSKPCKIGFPLQHEP